MGAAALSHQDLLDLQEIAQHLPQGDPRQGKVSKLLNSQPTEFEQKRSGGEGGLGAFGSDVAGMVKGIPNMVAQSTPAGQLYLNSKKALEDYKSIQETGKTVQQRDDDARKAAGYGAGYRAIAPIGEAIGVNAKGMEAAAEKGDTGGVLGHTVAAAAPLAVPGIVRGAAKASPFVRSGIAKLGDFGEATLNNDVAGLVNPRLPYLGRKMGQVADVVRPKPSYYKSPAGPRFPSGAMEAEEGEYVDTPAPAAPEAQPPFINAEINPRQLSDTSSVGINAGEYSRGIGEVPVDITGNPPANVLGGNKGIIIRPPRQLKAARLGAPMNAEAIDDMGVGQEIGERVNNEGIGLRREASREFADRNDPSVPKWRRLAEFRAQMAAENVMREAELAQQIPVKLGKTRTPPPRATPPLGKPQAGQFDDMVPVLEESIRQAKAKRLNQQ